jgi:hypothetical protein
MIGRFRLGETFFALGIVVLIALNLYTLVSAYPETYALDSGITAGGRILAKDFSAYYIGAWRLLHNPSQIYTHEAVSGDYPILPQPEAYKYLPSFLVMICPLLTLAYGQALLVFDVFQFALLPFMALFIYRLVWKKGLVTTFIVSVIVLLQPFPLPKWGFSVSYFWQWGEGQAKVLITFLLLLSFYLGYLGKPRLSGFVFALGFFDPRFGLLALPLFLMYNRRSLHASLAILALTMLVSNLALFYPGTGLSFISMMLNSGVETPLYYYSFIPLLTIICLTAVNWREMIAAFSETKTKELRLELASRAVSSKS